MLYPGVSFFPLRTLFADRTKWQSAGADLGGGDAPPPQGLNPLTNQRVPPLVLFYDIHFRPTNPKIFLKAPLYANFEEDLAQFSEKCPKR